MRKALNFCFMFLQFQILSVQSDVTNFFSHIAASLSPDCD